MMISVLKNNFRVLFLPALLLFLIACDTLPTMYVHPKKNNVAIHAKPSYKSNVIGTFDKSSKLLVIDYEGKWIKVTGSCETGCDDQTGWVDTIFVFPYKDSSKVFRQLILKNRYDNPSEIEQASQQKTKEIASDNSAVKKIDRGKVPGNTGVHWSDSKETVENKYRNLKLKGWNYLIDTDYIHGNSNDSLLQKLLYMRLSMEEDPSSFIETGSIENDRITYGNEVTYKGDSNYYQARKIVEDNIDVANQIINFFIEQRPRGLHLITKYSTDDAHELIDEKSFTFYDNSLQEVGLSYSNSVDAGLLLEKFVDKYGKYTEKKQTSQKPMIIHFIWDKPDIKARILTIATMTMSKFDGSTKSTHIGPFSFRGAVRVSVTYENPEFDFIRFFNIAKGMRKMKKEGVKDDIPM